jgi:hypothetical protein
VVVARSEIRALKRVVKQLPVELLQQSSSASSCMRTRIVMEEDYTVCQHSTPFVLNVLTHLHSVSQYTSDVIVVPSYMNSTVTTPFLSHETVVGYLADKVW